MAKAKKAQAGYYFRYRGVRPVAFEGRDGKGERVKGHLLDVADSSGTYKVFIPGSGAGLEPGVYGQERVFTGEYLLELKKKRRELEQRIEALKKKSDSARFLGKLWNVLYRYKRIAELEQEKGELGVMRVPGAVYVLPGGTWELPKSRFRRYFKGTYGRLRRVYDRLRGEEPRPGLYDEELGEHAGKIAEELNKYRAPGDAYTNVLSPAPAPDSRARGTS